MLSVNIKDLMAKLNFSIDAQNELIDSLDILLKSEFLDVINSYKSVDFDFLKSLDETKKIAEANCISPYTAYMLLFLCMCPHLHKKYKSKGIDSKIFYDSMLDLRYKLEECKLVHKKCGTFVPNWYKGFFDMRIFALGRLQFEVNKTWFDCEVNGKFIPKNTKVLSVHIPRTGTPLEHNLVLESYKMAKDFFKNEFDDEIIFMCNSWLLYPWNRTVYKEGSNLAKFYDDFTVVSSNEYTNYSECWRLFDCLYDGNPDSLPNDTSLRRSFIKRIKGDEPIGYGIGMLIM